MPTRRVFLGQLISAAVAARVTPVAQTDPPREISGVYPALAMFNDERECGTGAVVAWAGRLWAITYGPHLVRESSDKLYEITPDLRQIARPESVGGTNANRLIHRESQQLFIGPYAIDMERPCSCDFAIGDAGPAHRHGAASHASGGAGLLRDHGGGALRRRRALPRCHRPDQGR